MNATVPAVSADEVAGVLARFEGCTTAKVKVAERGQALADDVCRVAAVRDAMGPAARIRVDANGGWDVAQAGDALAALAAYGLEYAEQPCAAVEELRELRIALARRGIDVPIAADESIRKAEDPLLVARREAADLIVVKVAPLGGVRAALGIVAECGLPAVVSSALDTSVGMAAGVALAAALPELPFACGLGTVALLDGDVTVHPLVPEGGVLPVGRVAVDPALLDRWAAPADRDAWWRQRVATCHGPSPPSADDRTAPAGSQYSQGVNIIFVEPGFPANQRRFALALAAVGANVVGVGESEEWMLDDELRDALAGYYRVGSVTSLHEMTQAVRFVSPGSGSTASRPPWRRTRWSPPRSGRPPASRAPRCTRPGCAATSRR